MSYYEVDGELKNILLSDWQFKVLDFSETGDVPDISIEEQFMLNTELEFDCINVISELYFVQTYNTLNISKKINHENFNELKRISSYHHKLLFLKKFFILELRECLKYMENEPDTISTTTFYKHPLYLLRNYGFLSSKFFETFLVNPTGYDNNYRLYLLIVLNSLLLSESNDIFTNHYYSMVVKKREDWIYTDNEITNLLVNEAKNIIHSFNFNIGRCQDNIIKLITSKDLEVFSTTFEVENFYETLKLAIEEKQSNLQDSNVNLFRYAFSKLNCYAGMTIHNTNYFTVNGLNDTPSPGSNLEHFIDCLKSILKGNGNGSNFEYVSISDDTRYYLSKGISITYRNFKKSTNKPTDYNRMFTCCERKLIAKILDLAPKGVKNIDIVTSKPPCAICQKAFNSIMSNRKCKYNICPKFGESWAQLPIEEYDKFANQLVFNKIKRKKIKSKKIKKNQI